MRLSQDQRAQGLIDADYCLQIAHDMIDIFQKEEEDNKGFNSLEMLMIKSVFDDLFENTIKSRYKEGRNQVINFLSKEDIDLSLRNSNDNVVSLFDFLDKSH
ncbi:hypothetical protein [Orenia marismortui]|uniref:Uncharacterized protein n=1 Tax=Orenia marismortui TaxID=46469 RepID=A0A4R8H8W6_9FIRM|nr:hypothetical protein [Orenia marismortui]TDX51371.1 hypothetical protein C7959_11316 [Orenia marismortui]